MGVPKQHATKEQVLKLMAEKEKLESRITEYGAVLSANANVGMNGPLIDSDGFPRNDIDVYQVRQARQQIICLQNDHKALMKQIELELHKLHAEERQQEISHKAAGMQLDESVDAEMSAVAASVSAAAFAAAPLQIIAKVNLVSPGSPAEDAGLCVNDGIIEFGTINSRNFSNDLNQIAAVVRHMQNQRVALKVQRMQQQLDLILIPKTWSGRGLLGCVIVLPDTIER